MSNQSSSYNLNVLFGASIGYIVIGLPTGVCSLIIAGSILKYRPLRRRKEMVILMGLALADGLNLLCFVAAGIYRIIYMRSNPQLGFVTSVECLGLPHLWLWSFSMPLSNQMLVAVSADRFLLVTLRDEYVMRLGLGYAWAVVGGLFGFNFVFAQLASGIAWAQGYTSPTLDPMCYPPKVYGSPDSIVTAAFEVWCTYSSSLFPLVSVVVFALIAPIYKYKQRQVATSGGDIKYELKVQQRLTNNMAISCVCTFLLACIPGRLGYMFMDDGMLLPGRFCFLLIICNPMANILIYHFGVQDIRIAAHAFTFCKILPDNLDLWPGKRTRMRDNRQHAARPESAVV